MSPEIVEKTARATAPGTEPTWSARTYRPNVDIVETADELTLYADMPGSSAESIDVQFENGLLTITGRVRARQAESQVFLAREYGVGNFQRTFEVSESIDADKITAEFAQGGLTLHLPKVESARPRKIQVSVT